MNIFLKQTIPGFININKAFLSGLVNCALFELIKPLYPGGLRTFIRTDKTPLSDRITHHCQHRQHTIVRADNNLLSGKTLSRQT